MAMFRGRSVPRPQASQLFIQLCCVLFVLGASFGVLFLVMTANEQLACDYTESIDHCSDQPFYRTEEGLQNELNVFDAMWMQRAQDIRNETEEMKCNVEEKMMKDLTALHHTEAVRIVDKCHAAFQKCYEDLRTGWTYTTTTTTSTSTQYVIMKVSTSDRRSACQQVAEASARPADAFYDCITGGQVTAPPTQANSATRVGPPPDCTRCDSFCRAFNWTQLDPNYASAMNYTSWTCGPKVCPWIPECGSGPNLHSNCSERGCPCERATCLGPPGGGGGRLLSSRRAQAEAPTTTTTTSFVPYTTTTTTEDLENNTECTCKPGYVDTVLVGRPFKVFFGDADAMTRRRTTTTTSKPTNSSGGKPSNSSGGRRLRELDEEGFERSLGDLYNDANVPIEHHQGVHIEMEEEIIVNRERHFSCKDYFSDRYRYVYPRTVGEPHSIEALLARQSHPDLGCGYKGGFKVSCEVDYAVDNKNRSYDSGNCSWRTDISTCVPPNYQEAIDHCYVEEAASGGVQESFVPKVKEFMEVEDLNVTGASSVTPEHPIEAPDNEQCCAIHVGSECVPNRDHNGTVSGTWDPAKSYNRQVGYFPQVPCNQQAKLIEHICPRVKIKKLEGSYQHDMIRGCDHVCNLTSAQEELAKVCDDSVFRQTRQMQDAALKDKIFWMTAKRRELQRWSESRWPKVLETKEILDCVDSVGSRRYNMIGWSSDSSGYDKLKLRYECRMHRCSSRQCVKVTRKCPIPKMSTAPETTCGPFGDQNLYTCVDKVSFSSGGAVSQPVAYCWLSLSGLCFLCSMAAGFAGVKKKSRVHPVDDSAVEGIIQLCDMCGDILDETALDDGSLTCTNCIKMSQMPEVCRNCGAEFEDAEDAFCTVCQAPREMMAITGGEDGVCPKCGEPMGETDAKCLECGWHPEGAIVLKADTGSLRANANSASNERRIVAIDPDEPVVPGSPIAFGRE